MATDNEQDRRQFARLDIGARAIAIDAQGRELGLVSQASGGGMQIECASAEIAASLKTGDRLRVTIHEPESNTSNTFDVEVRFHKGLNIGVQFAARK